MHRAGCSVPSQSFHCLRNPATQHDAPREFLLISESLRDELRPVSFLLAYLQEFHRGRH